MSAHKQSLDQFCERFGVSILYVFGSRAEEVRGWLDDPASSLAAGPSDVDIGVLAKPGAAWTVRDKVRMANSLEDLLGCSRVDLVSLPDADPFVAAEVIRGERLWAADSDEADEYDLYVLRRAGDLAPLERERLELIWRGSK